MSIRALADKADHRSTAEGVHSATTASPRRIPGMEGATLLCEGGMSATAARHQRLPMPLSGRGPPDLCRCRGGVGTMPPLSTIAVRPAADPDPTHVGPRSVPADVLIRRADPYATLLGRPVGVLTRPCTGSSIDLLMVVRSGQAGGVKGAGASLTDESLAAMSPFALVRRGVGGWSCGDSNPGPSHCEGVPDPIGHRSMRCMSCALTATVPRCRPRGAPGGHANRSLAGEPGHRRGSTFEPCVPLKAALPPRRAVSDRHVHDLRRRPTSRCHFVSLIQPVPTRPHRFRQISDRLPPHHPRG